MAVEGESEQSFVRWLQTLSDEKGAAHIHLDAFLLGGGGFKTMLENAMREHKRRCKAKGAYEDRFLLVDEDRADQGDWPIAELKREAGKHKFTLCVQRPNHEGLLLRMMPGMEREIPDAASARAKLKGRWAGYEKPARAQTLWRQFSLDDILRVAALDSDVGTLLRRIGLM